MGKEPYKYRPNQEKMYCTVMYGKQGGNEKDGMVVVAVAVWGKEREGGREAAGGRRDDR